MSARGMTVDPDVTVVISSYNQREFLGEAIRSVQAQSVPCRILVADDGSDDGSPDLADAMGAQVLRLPHKGAFDTFRIGLAAVRTPFFVLLGGDDRLDPNYIERTRAALAEPGAAFVYTGMRWFGAEERVVRAPPYSVPELLWNNYAHASSLTRLDAYHSVGGLDRRFSGGAEDWSLWVALVAAGWHGIALDEPLLEYRRHPTGSRSASRRYWAGQRIRWKLLVRHPTLYLRHSLGIMAVAWRQLTRRATGNPSPWR